MDQLFSKTKSWLSKTVQNVKEKFMSLASILVCLQHCRRDFSNRPQRRRNNRQARKSNLATTENSLKISLDDGPPLPGVLPMDDFHASRPRPGDSSNSTTTEETASDDSLLGSPNVDQRNDRRLVQAELSLNGHEPRWTGDDSSTILHVSYASVILHARLSYSNVLGAF